MKQFALYALIGFLAQMIDGSIGMAYGVSCRTFLRTAGRLPAPVTSAVIHIAEIPASLVSGIAHARIGNLDRQLLKRLLIPGVIGGVIGACFLSGMGDRLEKIIEVYLVVMGAVILYKAFSGTKKQRDLRRLVAPIGLAGGFLDATGGGGWGPVVTSTLVAAGGDVKKTIGTVNAAEFLVTVAQAATFAVFLRALPAYWLVILGLICGGVVAAPLAARVCKKIPARPLMVLVGVVIILLNLYALLR